MPRRFPKLGESNSFPYLENAKPFERHVTFDYSRYDYTATAKLCKVTWPSDYRHVVNWADAQERDAWFDSLEGQAIELSHGTLRTQTDSISLPVPLDVALTYNYVYMRTQQLTEDRPIDYENDSGIRVIGAFIDSCEFMSDSNTLFRLSVDIWTTYLPYKSVHGMMLDRGHAPMWALSASDYLENPIGLCSNLLAPDASFGDAGIVRGGDYQPLSTADPMYVLASTIPYSQISGITRSYTHNSTAPSYYDTGARNGEQVGVRSFQWGSGKGYEGMTNPATPTRADGSLPTGLYYYGISGASVANDALTTLFGALPVLATSLQAAFVVPSDLVTLGTGHTIEGVTLYEVRNKGLQQVTSFDVTKDLFGYPTKYADIAKLYTEPYAHLEISDDLGNSTIIAIEDTSGTVDVSQMLSIAFPALEWRAAVTNVANTGGDVRYAWTQLDGSEKAKTITNADFAATFLDFGIPTYALYLEARTERALRTWADGQQQRANALVAYQSTMRSANNSEHNAYDSNTTAKANADASADTAKENADASADTAKANTTRSTTNARTNTARENSYRTTAEQNARNYTTRTTAVDLNVMTASTIAAIQNNQVAATSQINNIVTGTAGSVAASAISGNAVGAVLGAATGAAGALNAGASYALIISTEAGLAQIQMDAAYDKAAEAVTLAYANKENANAQNTEINENNCATTDSNATATQTTTKANATRSQTTSKANASRLQATGNANAGYSRDTAEENAKQALENAQAGYQRSLATAGVDAPIAHGSYSGTHAHEIWENRGIHLRGITQAAGAIKQAGDTFLRYGYRLGAAWNVDDWVPNGRTYCYWQSTDLWQDVADVDNTQAERMLEAILAAGVTVWDAPEHVGRFDA